jgi:Flp pilus assembly pilin Flp
MRSDHADTTRDEIGTINAAIAQWERFRSDDSGQDIVEYALLGVLVGIASIVIWQALVVTVANVYGAADANVQIRSSCTPDPISAGGGCS